MKKSILEIYALAVCFVTVVCFVVAFGMAIYAVVGIADPEFTMRSWTYEQHHSNETYWASHGGNQYCNTDEKKNERPSEADLTKRREESYARVISSEHRDSAQMLVKTVIVILIDMVVFLFHWGIARRARSSAA